MATVNALPIKKGDQSIFPSDSGDAVKSIQDFLQGLPEVAKAQSFLKDFGQGYTLTDGNHYGKYELDTRKHIRDYQEKNKQRIVKLSGLTDAEVSDEISRGIISYATVLAIFEDQGKKVEQKEEAPTAPENKTEAPDEYPIQDPESATETPEATFFVKTINQSHRLALRKAPAYVKVSKEADADEDKKGKRVDMMPNGTLLKIIEPHVGFECLWHQVEVVDKNPKWDSVKLLQKTQKLFCFAEFVQPLKKTQPLLPVRCMDCTPIPSGSARTKPFPDWTKLDECEPFYDKDTCKYYITSDSRRESVLDVELESLRKEAMFDGVVSMLEFYDKQGGKERANKLISSQGFSTAEDKDFFLPERPNGTLKFLVGVSGKHFDAIPRNTEFFDGIPTLGGVMPDKWRSANYVYKDIKNNIDLVTKRFEEYAEEVKKFEGEVLDLDLVEEAKRLRDFMPVFDKFLALNGVVMTKDQTNSFEIGFSGPCFNLIYVMEKRGEVMIPLRIGIECFKRTPPVSYERTMGYLFYLDVMSKDVRKQKRRWISFVQDYSCPLPRIIPRDSGRGPTKAREYVKETVKNTPAKEREDGEIAAGRKEKHELRKSILDYVGDPLLSCDNIESVFAKMNSLEEVYKEVLNKVNIADLSSFVLSCLATKFSVQELTQAACKFVLNKMPYETLQRFMDYLPVETLEAVQSRVSILQEDPKYADPESVFKIAIKEQPSNVLCVSINKFDPGAVKLFLEKFSPPSLGTLKEALKGKFKPPTISIPDLLPTEDTMREVKDGLVSAVKSVLTDVLVGLIKVVFASICKSCSANTKVPAGESYGQANIADFLKADVKPGAALEEALGVFDIPVSSIGVDFDDFLNDLSSILTPSEICGLLRGTATAEVLTSLRTLLKTKYKDLFVYLSTADHIKKFFVFLARNIDMSVCEGIELNSGEVSESLCLDVKELRNDLMGGRISKELLDKQLQAVKARDAEVLEMLASLSEGDLVNDKLLQSVLGKPGCQNPSLPTPPSMEFLNRAVVDAMFDGVGVSFDSDMAEFKEEVYRSSIGAVGGSSQVNADYMGFVEAGKPIQGVMAGVKDAKNPRDEQARAYLNALRDSGLGLKLASGASSDILSQVQANLKDPQRIVPSNGLTFDFIASIPEVEKVMQEYEKKAREAPNGNLLFLPFMSKAELAPSSAHVRAPEATECDSEPAKLGQLSITEVALPEAVEAAKEEPGPNVVLKVIPKFSDGDVVNYGVFFNDYRFDKSSAVRTELVIADDLKGAVAKEDGELKGLPQPLSFAKMMTQKIMVAMTDSSKTKYDKQLYSYFRDKQFAEQTAFWMSRLSSAIAASKFFRRADFEALKLVDPTSGKSSECFENNPGDSFLDVEDLKRKTLSELQTVAGSCGKFSQYKNEKTDLERAASRVSISALVRLFVIEFFVKCLFAFQKFDMTDVLSKDVIVKFLVVEFQKFLSSRGSEFRDKFVEAAMDYGESRNGMAVGELEKDTGTAAKQELLTFEEVILYLFKEQIVLVSEKVQSKIGVGQSTEAWLLEQFGIVDLMDGYFEIKEYMKAHFGNRFVLEKYVKVCNGTAARIEPCSYLSELKYTKGSNEAISWKTKKETFSYGLRLNYYFDRQEFAASGLNLSFVPEMVAATKSYHVKVADTSATGIEYAGVSDEKIEHMYIVPIVSTEEDEEREEEASKVQLEKIYDELVSRVVKSQEYRLLFDLVFPVKLFLSFVTLFEGILVSMTIDDLDVLFHDTRTKLSNLTEILVPGSEPWWNRSVPGSSGNEGLFKEQMGSITASGPAPYLRKMALMTIPIIVKGLAERFDPCYQVMKRLDEVGALMAGLNWGSVPQMGPINIFLGFGWGPPLLQWGMLALSLGLLPGETKAKEDRENLKGGQGESNPDTKCKEKG